MNGENKAGDTASETTPDIYRCDDTKITLKGAVAKILAKTDVESETDDTVAQAFSPTGAIVRLAYFVGGVIINGMYIKKDMVRK